MIKIRPHHLLCIQAYIGKGYSKEFVENMNLVVNNLKGNKGQTIKIVDTTDDICFKCPNNIGGSRCEHDTKVLSMDAKVIKYLELKAGEYTYKSLLKRLEQKLTKEIFQDICSECEWYDMGMCKKLIGEEKIRPRKKN